jgi:hypothetical protein
VYNDLIQDPVSVVKAIYKQFHWTFTDEYERLLENYLEENRQARLAVKAKKQKGGALHTYTAGEWVLHTLIHIYIH